jgi:hypothetical protein
MKKVKVNVQFPKLGAQYAQQQTNKAVAATKNPISREQATETARKLIAETGAPPKEIAEIGRRAEAALKNKTKYPEFVKYMVDKGIATAEQLKKPNFQILSTMVVLGKVAEEM